MDSAQELNTDSNFFSRFSKPRSVLFLMFSGLFTLFRTLFLFIFKTFRCFFLVLPKVILYSLFYSAPQPPYCFSVLFPVSLKGISCRSRFFDSSGFQQLTSQNIRSIYPVQCAAFSLKICINLPCLYTHRGAFASSQRALNIFTYIFNNKKTLSF